MKNKLMKLSELGDLLEYSDQRSILRWCKQNQILIFHVGKARYVASEMIDKYFENKLKGFANRHYDEPNQIMDAYHADDKLGLSESMEAPMTSRVKKQYRVKKERSKSAQEFLNQLKQA